MTALSDRVRISRFRLSPAMASRAFARFSPRPTVYRLRPTAFTLIELLVVIVVIAILMGITIPVSKYAIYRAKAARQIVMLAKIRSALDDYRATYGEYPITPDTNGVGLYDQAETSKHYWDNVMPDINTFSNSIFTNVNLSTNTIETLFTYVGGVQKPYFVDYCLTFPLMLRQEREGKRVFISFKKVTVMSQIYQYKEADDKRFWVGKRRLKGGGFSADDAKIYYGLGDSVDRAKAIDPVSGRQWKYECYDGTSYTIKTNQF